MTHRDSRVGRRVRLISTSDPYTRLEPGTLGTVRLVDDMGTVHVKWDDGSSLGLVPREDRFEYVRACDVCSSLLHYVADYGAPGIGQSWACDNGHQYQRLGETFSLINENNPPQLLNEGDVQ